MNQDLSFALHLADLADALTLEGFLKGGDWTLKTDGTPATEIDHAVEGRLAREVAEKRPHDHFLGEETGRTRRSVTTNVTREWIIDPIDQTRHYLRGNPEFATLIALRAGDHVSVGVVSAPALGHRWWAARGQGAWKDGRRIAVSRTSRLDEAYVAIAGIREWHAEWEWSHFVTLLSRCSYPTGCPGGFMYHMLLAEGAFDLFMEPWGEIWDHAASSLIIEEAGGHATTLSGAPPVSGSLLATNSLLHAEALKHLVPKQ